MSSETKAAVTKDTLARLIAHDELAPSITAASRIVDTLFYTLRTALVAGHPVHVKGFGRFEVTTTKARVGRNPKTGEPATIPARRKIKFRPSKKLTPGDSA